MEPLDNIPMILNAFLSAECAYLMQEYNSNCYTYEIDYLVYLLEFEVKLYDFYQG